MAPEGSPRCSKGASLTGWDYDYHRQHGCAETTGAPEGTEREAGIDFTVEPEKVDALLLRIDQMQDGLAGWTITHRHFPAAKAMAVLADAAGCIAALRARPPETEASEALDRIAEYEDGWDSYGAPAFTSDQIELARKVVAATQAVDVCPYAGGIAVEVTRDLTIYVEDPDPTHGGPEAVARATPPAPSSSPSTEAHQWAMDEARRTLAYAISDLRDAGGSAESVVEAIEGLVRALSTTHEEPEDG